MIFSRIGGGIMRRLVKIFLFVLMAITLLFLTNGFALASDVHDSAFDARCASCHDTNLKTIHITKYNLSCNTCHQGNLNVKSAITFKQKLCSDCHTSGHGLSMVLSTPPTIPIYPSVEWNLPIAVSQYNGENWVPSESLNNAGSLLIANRANVSGDSVWTWYKTNMQALGWTVDSAEPASGSNFYQVSFSKLNQKAILWFYGGANHTAGPLNEKGYRIELIYWTNDAVVHPIHINATDYGLYQWTKGVDCSSCHSSLTLKDNHPQQFINNCNVCHETQNVTVSNIVQTNLSDTAKPGYTCSDCHNSLPNKHFPEHIAQTIQTSLNCATCHPNFNNDLQDISDMVTVSPIHSQCNTCHSNLVNSNIKQFIADRKGKSNLTYACEDCHIYLPNNHAPEHMAKTTQINYTCSGCHASKFNGTSINDISKIHTSCSTCHSPTVNQVTRDFIAANKGQANSVYNCEACHGVTNGAKTHNKQHEVTSFTADITNNTCLGCHPKDVSILHSTATLNCDTCHSNNNSLLTPVQTKAKGVIAANLSSNANRTGFKCTDCHDFTAHKHTVITFETSANLACANCHLTDPATKTTDLTILHKNKGFSCEACHNNPLLNGTIIKIDGTVNIPTCSTCHNGFQVATADTKHASHGSANGYGSYIYNGGAQCITCHPKLTITDNHKTIIANNNCNICHNSNDSQILNVIQTNLSDTKKPGYTCADCHNSKLLPNKHAPEHLAKTSRTDIDCILCHNFNNDTINDISLIHAQCNTCHSDATSSVVKEVILSKKGNNNAVYSCEECHPEHPNITNAHVSKFVANIQLDCTGCHDNNISKEHAKKLDANGNVYTCSVCHKSQTENVRKAIKEGNSNCDACHQVTHNQPNKIEASHTVATNSFIDNQKYDCSGCHQKSLATEHINRLKRDGTTYTCNTCHENPNVKQMITGITIIDKSKCNNCHTIHKDTNDAHYKQYDYDTKSNCQSCHPMHPRNK